MRDFFWKEGSKLVQISEENIYSLWLMGVK
jgi:hypothetical protein